MAKFESWMVSNIAAGAATLSFIVLLIPPFITQVTGSAVRAGIVLAVIGLAALTGPYIGRLADRRQSHRALYSPFGISLCFALMTIATLGAIANNGMTSQIANIMPAVYGFTASQTSGIIGIAGLLSIGAIVFSGWWMRRRGAFPVYFGGSTFKWIGCSEWRLLD